MMHYSRQWIVWSLYQVFNNQEDYEFNKTSTYLNYKHHHEM